MQNDQDEDIAAGWRPSPTPYEPRGPLTLWEHALFAFLLVAILGLSTLLVLMTGGAA